MNSFFEWLAMGGYSSYVWSAYGLVTVVLLTNIFGLKWKKKQTYKQLQHWFKRSL